MDGDVCPLAEIVQLSEKYDATLIVDEAHSTGVAGPNGAGLCVENGLQDKIAIRIYTFGKAMGVHGACVVGSQKLIQFLINFARPFIYTTALSQHAVASIHCAFVYLRTNIVLQQTLKNKIDVYLRAVENLPNRIPSPSAIQTVLFPGNDVARGAADTLQKKGFDVRPILYPTVLKQTERLRLCLHSFNSDEEIASLTNALRFLP
jgi:8-amino-7-oxononanoate synthase